MNQDTVPHKKSMEELSDEELEAWSYTIDEVIAELAQINETELTEEQKQEREVTANDAYNLGAAIQTEQIRRLLKMLQTKLPTLAEEAEQQGEQQRMTQDATAPNRTPQEQAPPRVQRADWVTTNGLSLVGCVKRIARDGSWADVDWGTHAKRMQTQVLHVQTTIHMGEWEVTDMTRQNELQRLEEQHEGEP